MVGNRWLKKLLHPQSYGLAIAIAIILHVIVIALFATEWPKEKRQLAGPTPKNIQANVIQVENKQVKQRKIAEKKRLKNENWKKYLAEKKVAEKKAAKIKAAQEKSAKDNARRAEAVKNNNKAKALADKKKAEDLRKEEIKKADIKKAEIVKARERLQQEKLAKQKAEQQAFDEAQEQALMESLAVEQQQRSIEKAMADEQRTRKNVVITNDVVAQIRAKISQVWRYPPSARPDMEVVVRIQLVPTGEVINVSIINGSGNEALDRSVLAAVNRAQPLPVPREIRLFEQQFRNFVMAFRPEDAVW